MATTATYRICQGKFSRLGASPMRHNGKWTSPSKKPIMAWQFENNSKMYKYCTEEFISMKNRAKAEMSEWLKTANGKKFLASQY